LARFDSPETRAALTAAHAERRAAETGRALAIRQEARVESLFTGGLISSREREVANNDRRSADARLGAASAALEALERGAEVRAPFTAVVVRRHVDAGADVSANDALLDLRSAAALEAVADVPEGAVAMLQGESLRVQSSDGVWHAARLARLDGMTDFRSRTRRAHFALPSTAAWEPGAFARVALGGTEAERGTVPPSSLVRRGALTGVYVVANGTSRLRWLRLGREDASGVEVLAGLEPGEAVALDAAGLADGRATETLP
jgi:RND family efflux transporter MFP subunit